ncbi:hypothetical protein [Vibrio mediterranei]|uniref:Uncharacterized protein n=2 Tax=Vibrio mediterranei TaxID=689 RepID=A0ABX5D4A8_9VIBR|nr:hypothetical protein [Vibrio mediterranei]PCD85299.1 hypothetical protein COR52_27485 [Vibrio mediterranei]PRQ64499.1 hypothetical protein COR51_27190 [Vibrio mediterranei]
MNSAILSPDVEDILWVISIKKGGASITLEDIEPIIDKLMDDFIDKSDNEFKDLSLKRKTEFLVVNVEKNNK